MDGQQEQFLEIHQRASSCSNFYLELTELIVKSVARMTAKKVAVSWCQVKFSKVILLNEICVLVNLVFPDKKF